MKHPEPLSVEVTRGNLVESLHSVHAAIVVAEHGVLESWGHTARHIYPRSAIKPIQALPLVESGAADAFSVSNKELALACASHQGEPMHVKSVTNWLARIGCSIGNLECGMHSPVHVGTFTKMICNGEAMGPQHNNCSGKHAGFLTTARHFGEETAGYTKSEHPVQQRLKILLSELGDIDLRCTERGMDGCGIPVIGMPLDTLALAMARMAAPETMPDRRRVAAKQIFSAMTTYPKMVRGTGGFDTVAIRAGEGRFVTKTGAEGVHIAIIPELKLGIALKVEDGNGRASQVAIAALLDHVGVINSTARHRLSSLIAPPVLNAAGSKVGEIRLAKT